MNMMTYKNIPIRYEYVPCQHKPEGNLLLIHSLGLTMEEFDPIFPYFLAKYNVLRFDLFGHGQSGSPTEAITLDHFVEQMVYMTRLFFDEPFYIMAGPGNGYGAARFCRLHDSAAGLVMISPQPVYLSTEETSHLVEQIEAIAAHGFDVYKAFLLSHFTINQENAHLSWLEDQLNQLAESVHLGLIRASLTEDYGSDFHHLDTPILILSGIQDTLLPTSVYGMTATYMQAQYIMIPNAAHLVAIDNPEATAIAVLDFITNTQLGEPMELGLTIRKKEIAEVLHSGFGQRETEPFNTLHVELIHTFHIRIGSREIIQGWNLRKVKSLFLYLLVHGTVKREELIEVFWSELPLHNARNQLRMNLHFLKSLLHQGNSEFLHTDREHVFLSGAIQCDAVDYIKRLKEAYTRMLGGDLDMKTVREILETSPKKLVSHVYDEWYLQFRNDIEDQYTSLCQWTSERLSNPYDSEKYKQKIKKLDNLKL